MADAAFTKLVPGFDFLQGLVKNAGSALPNIGQWVAPTLNPEELEKRIEELRTVQFWLEQNARMLGATIQALEVQRMTLSTLRTMNVQMSDLRESLKIKLPEQPKPAAAEKPAPKKPVRKGNGVGAKTATSSEAASPQAGVVDPMQWWGALTRQFTDLATSAMKEGATEAAKSMAAAAKPAGNPAAAAPKQAGTPPAEGKAAAKRTARKRPANTSS